MIASGSQVVLGDALAHPAFDWPAEVLLPSELLTPVIVDGRCIAVLGVYDEHRDRFEPADALAMQTVADQVAATCRGVLLREQSDRRAQRLAVLERRHRVLMERLVRAQEQERSRVAADLHDDTIQVMSACVISLDSVRLAMQDGNVERAAAGLKQVADLISGAVERTRRMTFELRPAVLWHHGLVTAVEQSLDTLEREIGVTSSLEVAGMEARIDATMETLMFRSITEILSNVRAHAAAESVAVRLERHADVLQVTDRRRRPRLRARGGPCPGAAHEPPGPRIADGARGRRRRDGRDHHGARRGHGGRDRPAGLVRGLSQLSRAGGRG